MKEIVRIDFQLLGTKTLPDDITRVTGIVPDTALMRGERNKALDLPRHNIWSFRSHSDSEDVPEHWHELEPALIRAREKIREIAATGAAKFTIVISSKDRVPSILIPPTMSSFAGYVGAVIDIDHLQS